MSKESYAMGFCKAAEAAGVDPVALAKYAQQTFPGAKPGPSIVNAAVQNAFDAGKNEGVGILRKYVRPVTPLVHPAVQDEMNYGLAKDIFYSAPKDGARRLGSLMRSGIMDAEALKRDFVPGYAQRAKPIPNYIQRLRSILREPIKPGLNKILPFYSGK